MLGNPMKLRCIVVEDQLMFLELLVATLRIEPYVDVVATATSVQEGLLAVERHKPDLGIFDLILPGGDGLLLARMAKELHPSMQCILLTAQPGKIEWNPELGLCFRAIVDKVRAFDVLLREIGALLKEKFPSQAKQLPADPGLLLTGRELEIFQLVGHGHTNKQIAAELFISQRTVESHRKSITRKLKSSGSELVRKAALYCQRMPSQTKDDR